MDAVRIDKWLWAARFFKTRSLAKDAVVSGKVKSQGVSLKPSINVRKGLELSIRRGLDVFDVVVLELSDKRGSAQIAQQLYEETQLSLERRERARLARQAEPKFENKPDKKQRRRIRMLKQDS